MDLHRTYRKESVLGPDDDPDSAFINRDDASSNAESNPGGREKKKQNFIWTFMIRPVHDRDVKK